VDILERKTDLIQRLLKELTKQNVRLAEADAEIAEQDATIKHLIEYLEPMVGNEEERWFSTDGACPVPEIRAYLAKLKTGQ